MSYHKSIDGEQNMVGSCIREHVPFGEFLSNLIVGSYVDCCVKASWTVGQVIKIHKDNTIVRRIKVSFLQLDVLRGFA